MWYDVKTNTTYQSEHDVRNAFQSVLFASTFSDEQAAVAGLIPLIDGEKPPVTPYVNTLEAGTVTVSEGKALRSWVLRPLTTQEIAIQKQMMLMQCDAALTAYLDSVAQSRRYDNRITLAVRAGYPNDWQAEATAFGTWMDTCNKMAYQFMQEVLAGTRPCPVNSDELLAALPPMVWPTTV